MQVEMLTTAADASRVLHAGKVYDLKSDEAESLLKGGYAKEPESKGIRGAIKSAVQKVTGKE